GRGGPGVGASRSIHLGLVLAAGDDRIELDAPALERGELSGGRDEDACPPGAHDGVGVTGAEIDRIAARDLVPGKGRVVSARAELGADRRYRPLPHLVDVREPATLGRVDERRVD